MLSFFDWLARAPELRRSEWLLLGKGPSFARRGEFDCTGFATLSLNHAVREQPVTAAHLIDLDVADACGDALRANARVVVMPWHPHVDHRPGTESLEELARTHPVLRDLAAAGRLVGYDSSLAPQRHRPDDPLVRVRYFSAEAALHLLALAGVARVRSLGVDGGTAYSGDFADLEHTRLANGQDRFDLQFEAFPSILLETGVRYAPLGEESPVQVYVGAEAAQALPARVLEFSLRRRAARAVEVFSLERTGARMPLPRDPANRPRTPFSFQRFAVPQAAGHRGRALYLDSDMLVFRDVGEIWNTPFQGADALTVAFPPDVTAQHSVLLLDCAALDWNPARITADLDAGRLSYAALVHRLEVAPQLRAALPFAWNHLEHFEPGVTALLHYTDMTRQPWLGTQNPLGALWVQALLDALESGFLQPAEIERAARRGYVRPSLLREVERGEPGAHGPGSPPDADRRFRPPLLAPAGALLKETA